jgi:DNA-binding MarR family transcriptional regulator
MTGSTTGAVIESTPIRLIRAFFYRSAFVFCARRQRNLPNAEQECSAIEASMDPYLAVISYVERLHRQFLEVLKLELEGLGIHDINNVQAMMLFNIGDAEMTVGELTLRGCYLGSNVSYNVKKMVENKYLAHERSVHDRRSIHVQLTEKGIKLRDSLTVMHQRHAEMLSRAAVSADDLQATTVTLRRLERFWIRAADLVQRPQPLASDSSRRPTRPFFA